MPLAVGLQNYRMDLLVQHLLACRPSTRDAARANSLAANKPGVAGWSRTTPTHLASSGGAQVSRSLSACRSRPASAASSTMARAYQPRSQSLLRSSSMHGNKVPNAWCQRNEAGAGTTSALLWNVADPWDARLVTEPARFVGRLAPGSVVAGDTRPVSAPRPARF